LIAQSTLPRKETDGKEVETVAGIEAEAGATVEARDFGHLERLRDDLGHPFAAGVVLYTGREIVGFGDRLHAVPVWTLWRAG